MTGKGEPLTDEEVRILEPKSRTEAQIFQSLVNISTQIVDCFKMHFASYDRFVLTRTNLKIPSSSFGISATS